VITSVTTANGVVRKACAIEYYKSGEDSMEKQCNVGLDRRCRDNDGEIRQKRSDTLVRTLRKEYGEDFADGFRGDMKLGNLLKRTGKPSLSQLIKPSEK